ncbi:MAG: TlpA family protein disulfide reductase [Chitinophagales bacterium]|nr:TlpA family protein disulfide reductase [Chitinophagales bacterium]
MKPILLITVILLSISCNAQPDKQQKDTPTTTLSRTQNATTEANWPSPNKYVEGIPVYESYSDIAPMFALKNDTTYVINFWATWCQPCVKELPHFEQLTEKYKDSKVKVVLVSLDFPKQLESKLVPFVKKHELKSTVVTLLDGKYNDWIDKVSKEWSGAIPATLFYRADQQYFLGHSVESTEELENVLNNYIH